MDTAKEYEYDKVMRDIGITRICCKRMFITFQDVGLHMVAYQFNDIKDTVSEFRCTSNSERIVNCE